MSGAARIALAIWATLVLTFGIANSQVPMTGAGKGAPGGGAPASVMPDVLGTAAFQSLSNNFNYTGLTITAGLTNPGLVCWLIRASAALDVTIGVALTWDGVAMTLRQSQSSGATSGVFLFGLRNPASGNKTLNVSATNVAADNFVNCVSFSNVNQTSDALAFPNPTGAFTVTSIAVTSASGHIAVGGFSNGSNNGTILGVTVINDASSGAIINAAADYVVSSGASTTVGTSTTQNTIAGMDISN